MPSRIGLSVMPLETRHDAILGPNLTHEARELTLEAFRPMLQSAQHV